MLRAYSATARSELKNPERAEKLFTQNEKDAMDRYDYLSKLVDLYDGTK